MSITINSFTNEIVDYKISTKKEKMISIPNISDTIKQIKNPLQTIIHSDYGKEYISFEYFILVCKKLHFFIKMPIKKRGQNPPCFMVVTNVNIMTN